MATALRIEGRRGYHEFINDTYEPASRTHNDRPFWVSRSVRPLYLFHTGQSRWVVSKRLDDGQRCYAYLQANGDHPAQAQGSWTCCEQDGTWKPDANVQLSAAKPSNDVFVHLRMTVDTFMDEHRLNDPQTLKQMWKRIDFNGNNIVSLAELDKLVVDLVDSGAWPPMDKRVTMRAFKKSDLLDGDGDNRIEKEEFHCLLLNMFWFHQLWDVFDAVDTGHDHKISTREFQRGMEKLGLDLSQREADDLFRNVDHNHDGQIYFTEFCAYARERITGRNASGDADIVSGENCGRSTRRNRTAGTRGGSGASPPGPSPATGRGLQPGVVQRSMKQFQDLEDTVKAIIGDKTRLAALWQRCDSNGNGVVSLAELGKFVRDIYPLLDHQPALMRAFKAADCKEKGGDGDERVSRKEFKTLLGNLFYFNKIFWLWDYANVDKDSRLDVKEFSRLMSIAGVRMKKAEVQQEFRKVDTNGGGYILFDEFCQYFTAKRCPECFRDLLD